MAEKMKRTPRIYDVHSTHLDPAHDPHMRSTSGRGLIQWILQIVVASVISGIVAFIATFIHRSGVDGAFPWGLVLAFLLLGGSAWIARVFVDQIAVGFTLLVSSIVIWTMALVGTPQTSVLIPVGSPAFTTWFSSNAGFIWLFGSIVIQVIIFFLPNRWFKNPFKATLTR